MTKSWDDEYTYWNYMTNQPMTDGEEIRTFLEDMKKEKEDKDAD